MAKVIELTEYRRKDINAYVARLELEKGKFIVKEYLNPTDYESQELRGRGKPVTCFFDKEKLNIKDGYFLLREACGHRSYKYWCLFKDYENIAQFDSEVELLEHLNPTPNFPQLEGSYAQINYASDIRKKAYQRWGLSSKIEWDNTNSKYWITWVSARLKDNG